jgi:lipoyl-dependent peroxiredoxin
MRGMATRNGSADWKGDLQGGTGTVRVGDGVFTGDYSFSSRFEEGEGTNPEELIAGAHAACFAMALSNDLAEGGHTPDSVQATARVQLRNVDGAPTIARIDLDVVGAKRNCPVSRALASVPEINLNARLG